MENQPAKMEVDYSLSVENQTMVPTHPMEGSSNPAMSSMYIIKSVTVTPGENGQDPEDLGKVCTLDFSILPRELQDIVVKELDIETALKLRASCRKWKHMVDDFGLFDVVLNERQGFNGLISLPMRKCEINWLKSAKMRTLFLSRPPQEVIIRKEVSRWIIREMLRGWKFMRNLRWGWRALASTYLFHYCPSASPKRRVLLSELHTLKIEMTQAPDSHQDGYLTLKKNLEFIFSWEYPSLEKLNVTFVFTPLKEAFLDMMFPFIARHASTLRTLEISLKYSLSHHQCLNFQQAILFESVPWPTHRGHFNCVKDVRVTTWILHCPFRSVERLDFWREAITNRNVLGHMIASRFLSPNLSRLSYFSSSFNLYSIYLQRVDIVNMSIYSFGEEIKSEPANLALLEGCVNLKYLSIRRAPILLLEAQPVLLVEAINMNRLPKSITHLRLDGFHVCSNDLKRALETMPQLESFELLRSAANPPDFNRHNYSQVGVNQEAFFAVLAHPNILAAVCHFSPGVPPTYPEPRLHSSQVLRMVREYRWEAQFSNCWPGCRQVDLCRFRNVL
ncbi:unnamed protein product [Allacma fusca]|uniref:F-box domain-containing protein n=1 Tax=Allacma fusca TaxID=39272 RepID=A0A8J2K7F2_9HEXA|nr:unnamed protein product [Allacma fusca]